MLSQINHVRVMLQVVGHCVAMTVLTLAYAIELDLRLMIGERGILGAPYSAPLLLDIVEQDKGVNKRLEVINVDLVSDLASEFLVVAP